MSELIARFNPKPSTVVLSKKVVPFSWSVRRLYAYHAFDPSKLPFTLVMVKREASAI